MSKGNNLCCPTIALVTGKANQINGLLLNTTILDSLKSKKYWHPSYRHKSSLHFSSKLFLGKLIESIKVPFLYTDALKKII
ncbi:MAG: hypothetical protein BA861_10825 [Desulfobacterales bacterium S3730MH5]|nr:MAG: hypothetical protein BA861_10825 [Desulfobacterales bacterium S3730MH5]